MLIHDDSVCYCHYYVYTHYLSCVLPLNIIIQQHRYIGDKFPNNYSLGRFFCRDKVHIHVIFVFVAFFTDETKKCELLQHLREQLTNKRMIYSKNQLQLSTTVGQGLVCVLCSNNYVSI